MLVSSAMGFPDTQSKFKFGILTISNCFQTVVSAAWVLQIKSYKAVGSGDASPETVSGPWTVFILLLEAFTGY